MLNDSRTHTIWLVIATVLVVGPNAMLILTAIYGVTMAVLLTPRRESRRDFRRWSLRIAARSAEIKEAAIQLLPKALSLVYFWMRLR